MACKLYINKAVKKDIYRVYQWPPPSVHPETSIICKLRFFELSRLCGLVVSLYGILHLLWRMSQDGNPFSFHGNTTGCELKSLLFRSLLCNSLEKLYKYC